MEYWPDPLRALLLLIVANAAPVLLAKLSGERRSAPLDFGYRLRGERLFGSHKTWRGWAAGTLACTIAAVFLELPIVLGAGFGAVSLFGDALSSALKRRLWFKPGAEIVGLDQCGEVLLPLVSFARPLSLRPADMVVVTFLFVALDVATAGLRHRSWLNR